MTLLLLLFVFQASVSRQDNIIMHIPTSDALRIAQIVARNEGYDTSDYNVYYFDTLDTLGKPLLKGYTSIGFYIKGNIRSSISINEKTGQAVDSSSCELFDYPELKPFQEQMIRLSKAKMKTAEELAEDVGCSSLKVLKKSTPISK